MHQRNAVAPFRFVHEVGREEDRHAFVAGEADQNAPEGIAGDRVDARGRLVEDQHLGPMQNGDGQLQALFLPKGQAFGPAVRDAGRSNRSSISSNARRSAVLGQAEEMGMELEILPNGQFIVERERLRHVADALACRHVAGVERATEKKRHPFRGRQQAREHLHRRALAAAVRAEKAEDLAGLDAEAHVIDRGELAEPLGQPLRLDGGRTAGCPARRDDDCLMAGAFGLRQKIDECVVERRCIAECHQFRRRAAGDHPAGVHRGEPIEPLRFFHIGRSNHDAHAGAPRADVVDQLPELAARQRVDPCGRLVEDQQVRIVDQRAAQRQLLLHAARQLAGRPVGKRIEAGCGEQFGDTPCASDLGCPNRRPKKSRFSNTVKVGYKFRPSPCGI